MLSWGGRRKPDRGASALEYGAVIAVAASVIAVIAVVAIPNDFAPRTRSAICNLFEGDDCGKNDKGDPVRKPSGGPSGGPTASPVGQTPEDREYDDAKKDADKAGQDADQVEKEWENFDLLKELGELGLDFIAGDIMKCIKKPNLMDCLWALVGIVPWGKIGKLVKSIPKVAKLVDRYLDLKRRLDQARKARKDAKDRLDRAIDACKKKAPNSFVRGTPVLMGDGSERPIEKVRVGDGVWATDPVTGRSGPRKVTELIVGQGRKRLVDLKIDLDGALGGPVASITVTADHPFWVPAVGDWIDAGEMVPGDELVGPGGDKALVVGAREFARVERVHNLSVSDLHTYYVSAGGHRMLVHNDPKPGEGPCGVPDDPIEKKIRDAGYTDPLPQGVRRVGKGIVDESENAFDEAERAIAEKLAAEGKIVKAKQEKAQRGETGRTQDSEIDGVPTEFKTLLGSKAKPIPDANTVKRALNNATGQAEHTILNASGKGISKDEVMLGLRRYLGQPHANQKSIRVFGDGWEINCLPSPQNGGKMWCT